MKAFEFNISDRYDPLSYAAPLYVTRASCANYIQYTEPLSYADWLLLPFGKKAAVLFVQFFPQITLAWQKVKSFYTPEEDAVTEMFKYIMKNIPLIEAAEKKFTPQYIYKVAWNCLYCICHDIKRDRDRWELETSNIAENELGECDLFDTVFDKDSLYDEADKQNLWGLVDKLPEEYQSYIAYILGEKLEKGMTKKRMAELKENLKVLLTPFSNLYEPKDLSIKTFGDIYRHKELVKSAVVTLNNGLKVCYYNGEIQKRGKEMLVTFFGPDQDYTYLVDDAEFFKVDDIEWAKKD